MGRAVTAVSYKYLLTYFNLIIILHIVIRRPRKLRVKTEPTSPQTDSTKRKFDMLTTSDVEYGEEESIDVPIPIVTKGGKGARSKSRQPKASTSKAQTDLSAAPTRKSTRLNASDVPVKKVRISTPLQEEQPATLFRRAAASFAEISHIFEEIAETVRRV